ncbi:hypothetical protein AVEN_176130-1 [Araneus ventricosus]|uniref:Uncharacterized protein n=1 Tax=Araneus ventricosus TaxID=182803 RepID=A0A4Y2K6B3_ARAVE|nr:hypothetical protein AVEN_176130-1 [Araneus ventricosus]
MIRPVCTFPSASSRPEWVNKKKDGLGDAIKNRMFFQNRGKDNYLFVLSLHQDCFANLQQACIAIRWLYLSRRTCGKRVLQARVVLAVTAKLTHVRFKFDASNLP